MTIGFFVLIVGAMYFLMIRPQNKRRREAMEMQSAIGPGDEVQTVGGLFGTVATVDDATIALEVAPGVELRFARQAIAKVIKRSSDEADADDTDAATPVEQA